MTLSMSLKQCKEYAKSCGIEIYPVSNSSVMVLMPENKEDNPSIILQDGVNILINKTTKRKNLDLTTDCIKEIAKEAIDKGTDFKNLAQDILEAHAKIIIADRQKSEGKK